jgi:hypothetical protein
VIPRLDYRLVSVIGRRHRIWWAWRVDLKLNGIAIHRVASGMSVSRRRARNQARIFAQLWMAAHDPGNRLAHTSSLHTVICVRAPDGPMPRITRTSKTSIR